MSEKDQKGRYAQIWGETIEKYEKISGLRPDVQGYRQDISENPENFEGC